MQGSYRLVRSKSTPLAIHSSLGLFRCAFASMQDCHAPKFAHTNNKKRNTQEPSSSWLLSYQTLLLNGEVHITISTWNSFFSVHQCSLKTLK